MDEKKQTKMIVEDLLIFLGGAACFSFAVFSEFTGDFALMLFIVAFAFMGISSWSIFRALDIHPVASLHKLKSNNQGIVWIWIVGFFLTIPMCALIYFVLDYPFDIILQTVNPLYTYTGVMASAWTATKIVIDYLLAFTVIFSVLWVVSNAKSPQGYY